MMPIMLRRQSIYRCDECEIELPRWMGRCHSCGAWGSLVQVEGDGAGSAGDRKRGLASGAHQRRGRLSSGSEKIDIPAYAVAQRLSEVCGEQAVPVSTGVPELDRVLSGGILAGSVTLLGGEPGVGKSTLLVQALGSLSSAGNKSLLFSAEESAPQVHARAGRLGVLGSGLLLSAARSMPDLLRVIDEVSPDVVAVDSIQTVEEPETSSMPGSVSQVRECAGQLAALAKSRGIAVILVGHVTKDGSLAGPRALEHLVDTVLMFEGDRHHALRFLRASKHRFGATGELGIFEMSVSGLKSVEDPSGLFLCDRRPDAPGSVVLPVMEGRRPLLVEVQALVAPAPCEAAKCSAQGIDSTRLSLLLAVLERRAGLSLRGREVFVSVVGGVKASEPSSDLAVCIALASAASGRSVAGDLVAFGEVGLGGELRQASQASRRLGEAVRLGYLSALVPASSPDPPTGMALLRASTVSEALLLLSLVPEIGAAQSRAHALAPYRPRDRRGDDDDVTCVGGDAS